MSRSIFTCLIACAAASVTASGCVVAAGLGGATPAANRAAPAMTGSVGAGLGGELGPHRAGPSQRLAGLLAMDWALVVAGDLDRDDYTAVGFGGAVRYERRLLRRAADSDVSWVGQVFVGFTPELGKDVAPEPAGLASALVGVGLTRGDGHVFRTYHLGVTVRRVSYDGGEEVWFIGVELGGAAGLSRHSLDQIIGGGSDDIP